MKVTLYDTRITDDYRTVLVEEKALEYAKDNMTNPQDYSRADEESIGY